MRRTRPRRTRVYVAGPISVGPAAENINKAVMAADELLAHGYAPFVPHLSVFWGAISPKSYETWMEYDFEWLGTCDCLLRLPGESPGADREIAFAEQHNIPIFYAIENLLEYIPSRRPA
jgi:hypothetical protein